MIIIGVDPALAATGIAVVEGDERGSARIVFTEEITTSPRDGLPARLTTIYSRLKSNVVTYQPAVMVLEKLYSHHRHPVTASLLGHVRGVACLLAGECALTLCEYAATRVSKALLGQGQASPEQMSRMVHQLARMTPGELRSEHIIDAAALAITYVHHRKWARSGLAMR